MLAASGHATVTRGRNNPAMESNRLLEDLLTLQRRQLGLLEEIRDLLEALAGADRAGVALSGVREDPRDLA
jgi:hypothetical protein